MFGLRGLGCWVPCLWVVLGGFSGFSDGLEFRLDGLGVVSGFCVFWVFGVGFRYFLCGADFADFVVSAAIW